MNTNTTTVKEVFLVDLMEILEDNSNPDLTTIMIDETSSVESFLTVKGDLFEIDLVRKKQQNTKLSPEEFSNEVRKTMKTFLTIGGFLGICNGNNWQDNFMDYLKQFKWFDPATFFQNRGDKKYLLKQGILLKEEDKDPFGNLGCWLPPLTKMCVVYNTQRKNLETIRNYFIGDGFEFIIVK